MENHEKPRKITKKQKYFFKIVSTNSDHRMDGSLSMIRKCRSDISKHKKIRGKKILTQKYVRKHFQKNLKYIFFFFKGINQLRKP